MEYGFVITQNLIFSEYPLNTNGCSEDIETWS